MLFLEIRLYDLGRASRESSCSATNVLHAFYVVPSGSDVPMQKFREAGDDLFGNNDV